MSLAIDTTSPAAQALQSRAQSTAATSGTTSSSTASSSTASSTNITSSDFMTLLVTEMQNQDPTQPTDPNAYIQQLVGVNSLQQLVSINQDLTPSTTTSTAAASLAATPVTGV